MLQLQRTNRLSLADIASHPWMLAEHATREEVQEELTRRRDELRTGRRRTAEALKLSEDTISRFRSFDALKMP